MSIWFWLAWVPILIFQNAVFTWTSRARNSGSVKWHGVASIFSNSTFFFMQVFLVKTIWDFINTDQTGPLLFAAVFYTTFTTLGAVLAHKFLLKYEKGKKQVGSR